MPSRIEHPRRPGRGAAGRYPARPGGIRGNRTNGWPTGVLALKIVAALMSFMVLVGSGWAWATYSTFTSNISRVDAIAKNSGAATRNIDGAAQNILIVGNDDRDSATNAELAQLGTTRDGGSYNTDTMMLMHIPADGSKATVISFPRDSYVAIPGHGMNKLNAAYPDGVHDSNGNKAAGAALLVQTIQNLTGLSIDHFVQVDLLGFYRISNAIGGVSVCLNSAMGPAAAYGQTGNGLDSGFEPNGTFVYSYSGINLRKGINTIKGKQALAFVRQRHGLPGGDLDRIKRQQYFLSAVFRKLSSGGVLLNPFKLQALLKSVTRSVTMDRTLDPLKLAQQMQNLTAGNVRFTTIPVAGDNPNSPVGDVVLVDTVAMPGFINTLIGANTPDALARAKPADPRTVTVAVVDDATANGLETTNSAALRTLGFTTTIPPATTDVLAKTTIEYPPGAESAAKALQAAVPGAVMKRVSQATTVTLLLGNNGVQVKSLMTTAPSTTARSTSTTPPGITAAQGGCIN